MHVPPNTGPLQLIYLTNYLFLPEAASLPGFVVDFCSYLVHFLVDFVHLKNRNKSFKNYRTFSRKKKYLLFEMRHKNSNRRPYITSTHQHWPSVLQLGLARFHRVISPSVPCTTVTSSVKPKQNRLFFPTMPHKIN